MSDEQVKSAMESDYLLGYNEYFQDLLDARAEIAELHAVIAEVKKLTRVKIRKIQVGWITSANSHLIAALGKYADEVAS